MSVAQRVRSFLWKDNADWREVVVVAAAIVIVIALIGTAVQ